MNDCFKFNNIVTEPRDLVIESGKHYIVGYENIYCDLFYLDIPSNDEIKYNTQNVYNLKYENINENNKMFISEEYKNTNMDFKISLFNIPENTAKQYLKILGLKYDQNQKINFIELLNDENFALLLAEKLDLPIELLIETDFFRKDCFISDILKYESVKSLSLVIRVPSINEYASNIRNIKDYEKRENNFGDTITHKYYINLHGSILRNRFVRIPENITVNLSGIPGYSLVMFGKYKFYNNDICDIVNKHLCSLYTYNDYIFDISLSLKDVEIKFLKKENKHELFGETFIKVPDNNDRNTIEDPRELYFERIFRNYTSNLRLHVPLSGLMRMLSLLYKNEEVVIYISSCLGIEDEHKEDNYKYLDNSFYAKFKDIFKKTFNDKDQFVYINKLTQETRYIYTINKNLSVITRDNDYLTNEKYYNELKKITDDRLCIIFKYTHTDTEYYKIKLIYNIPKKHYIDIELTKEEYDKLEKKHGKDLCLYDKHADEFIKELTINDKFPQFEKDNIEEIVPNWVEKCYNDQGWDKNKPIVFYHEDNNIK